MEQVKDTLARIIEEAFDVKVEPEVSVAPEETGADFATNVAMKLAKILHKAPIVIAEEIVKNIKQEVGDEYRVEVAAPGFINFALADGYFTEKVRKIADNVEGEARRGITGEEYTGKTVVAEFSDPNPFKVLHVGHLYTSIVGDSISRLLELAGAKVIRANFGGDVGLHVAKTLYVLMNADDNGELTIEDIARAYVEGTRLYDEDETAKAEITQINKIIYALSELGEEKGRERLELEMVAEDFGRSTLEIGKLAELYWRGRELSYQYFKDFYRRIGVKFDKFYPESSVAGRGLTEVKSHIGSVYEESGGAVVYHGEKLGLHTRVFINKEGVPTYEAKDVGLIFTKWDDWHFDESVVVTGNEQSDYMKVVLASVAEYAPKLVEQTTHLTHGLVKLPGHVKMSSRKGNFLKAVDTLEMVKEALDGEKVGDNSEKMVLAAIKYAFLRYKMGGDIVFDPQESVSTTGNSGVYLLYAVVRAKKVLAKAVERENDRQGGEMSEYERKLSKKVVQYGNVVQEAIREKVPNKVCTYLYELAQEFSRFYEHVQVVGGDREIELLVLVRAYLNVMQHGLGLLGIETLEEM